MLENAVNTIGISVLLPHSPVFGASDSWLRSDSQTTKDQLTMDVLATTGHWVFLASTPRSSIVTSVECGGIKAFSRTWYQQHDDRGGSGCLASSCCQSASPAVRSADN
jgi:hypothetical protein